jgi:hypothetical protein
MSCRLPAGPHYFIKGAPGHWNLSRLGAPFPFSRPWSTSYDTALPMLRSRSVTGWPHHLTCRAPACAGRSPKPPRSGAAPGRHATGMWQTRNAPALQAGLCGSVTRHLHHFSWGLPRLADCKSVVNKRAGSWPVEHYHQLPPLIIPTPGVPKPKSSRRTVVNRVTSGCKSRRNRHGLSWRRKALAFRTKCLK